MNVAGTQAYLTVPSDIKGKVLAEGYVCRSRDTIPCHRDFYRGTKGMLQYTKEHESCTSVVLEIHGVPDDWIRASVEDAASGGCSISTIDFKGGKMWLKPEYLRDGLSYTRTSSHSQERTCMFCDSSDHLDCTKRGRIGEARFQGAAFLCSPCTNPECLVKMRDRSRRLEEGATLELFHKTNKRTAVLLKTTSRGRMLRGDTFQKGGAAGGGIYLGHTPRECSWKYEAPGETVTFKCRVKMGASLMCSAECEGPMEEMFRHLQNLEEGPFDSVILDRSAKNGAPPVFPVPKAPVRGTRIEDLTVGEKLHPGYEFVVYSWDQVEVVCEVEEDPVPDSLKAKIGKNEHGELVKSA